MISSSRSAERARAFGPSTATEPRLGLVSDQPSLSSKKCATVERRGDHLAVLLKDAGGRGPLVFHTTNLSDGMAPFAGSGFPHAGHRPAIGGPRRYLDRAALGTSRCSWGVGG